MKTQTTTNRNTTTNTGLVASMPAKTIYDTKFKNDGEATIGGVFFFVVPIIFSVFCYLNNVMVEGIEVYITIMAVGALVLRAAATLWIANIAKELNRNHVQWMTLAFFVPGTALTMIGQKKKIKDVNEYKQHLYTPRMTEVFVPSHKTLQAGPALQMAS